jgi:hypothetical protein
MQHEQASATIVKFPVRHAVCNRFAWIGDDSDRAHLERAWWQLVHAIAALQRQKASITGRLRVALNKEVVTKYGDGGAA